MAFVLTLAFVNGCATVISKMINYRCTKILGTNNGSLVNYVVASVLSLILLFASSKSGVDLYAFTESTILLLVGQLTAGILFDAFVFQNISIGKILGIVLVAVGIIWDNKISAGDRAAAETKDTI